MPFALDPFWHALLRLIPTRLLQEALAARPGVDARFIGSGETVSVTVTGVCWLTVNQD